MPPDVRSMLEAISPVSGIVLSPHPSSGSVGSLGRPRFTLLAEWQGEFVAVEAKALIPFAVLLAQKEQQGADIQYEELLALRYADQIP